MKTDEKINNILASGHGRREEQSSCNRCLVMPVLEKAMDAIVVTDHRGVIVVWNHMAERLFGYSPDEALGHQVFLIIPQRFQEAHRERFAQCVASGTLTATGREIETTGRRKDGSEFPLEISLSLWSFGGNSFFTAILRDITERKKLEKELIRSRQGITEKHEKLTELFRKVERAKKEWEGTMDCIGDLVLLTDPAGRIRRCNRSFREFTNRSYPEILGLNWREFFPENQIRVCALLGNGMEFLHAPSGRWFILKSYPFDPKDPGTIQVITLHDSTELNRVQEELHAKNRELSAAYQELKNTQARILQQEKMASIGQLAAGVAHEINNPIGFVKSNLETLGKYAEKLTAYIQALETHLSPEAGETLREKRRELKIDYIREDLPELVRESIEGTERVARIVQNLKSFSRVDEAEYKEADINACLEDTINIVWNELKYKTTLKKDYGDLPLVKCYPQQLNQVFMNLLVNASQAIEEQGEISITTRVEGDSVVITISDTGCGIPKEKLHRIFEPFFTTKKVGSGTGLGLSITYDIVKKHGGEIAVESEVGKGTTFRVTLPMTGGDRHE